VLGEDAVAGLGSRTPKALDLADVAAPPAPAVATGGVQPVVTAWGRK
jgi:hypothetical protein